MPYMRTTQLALIMTSLMTIGTVMAQNEPSGDLQEMPSENGARQEHRSDRADKEASAETIEPSTEAIGQNKEASAETIGPSTEAIG